MRGLVRAAQEAEAEGIDGVMLSEHLVLGGSADANGRPLNPRDYAAPGNQDPATPWPDSIVLLSAIAAATTSLRLIAAAIIAPLRHPVLLAHQLAALDLLCEGRLVVQPTVSWHREEYAALGVPFEERGERLDEHLAAWRELWTRTPASFSGRHYHFEESTWSQSRSGPRDRACGSAARRWALDRAQAGGLRLRLPSVRPAVGSRARRLGDTLRAAGRDPAEIELVGGIRGDLGGEGVADLGEARPRRSPSSSMPATRRSASSRHSSSMTPPSLRRLCRRLVGTARLDR